MPQVAKLSAGYFAAPQMDLIDLFIGSEGTLGVVTEATLRVLPVRPAMCLAFVPFALRAGALAFVRQLRGLARDTWRTSIPAESTSRPSSTWTRAAWSSSATMASIVRRASASRPGTEMALLVTLELRREPPAKTPTKTSGMHASPTRRTARCGASAGCSTPRACSMPSKWRCPATTRARTSCWRYAKRCPASVNQRVGRAKQSIDARIEKTAADMVVPFERLDELLTAYETTFAARRLDVAIWGHISDGNLHPNVIPRSFADVEAGKAAILELGREAIRLGGAPLAEHGVGRNTVKQRLLEQLYGRDGIADMRAVKQAIDPDWTLAPGVLFQK